MLTSKVLGSISRKIRVRATQPTSESTRLNTNSSLYKGLFSSIVPLGTFGFDFVTKQPLSPHYSGVPFYTDIGPLGKRFNGWDNLNDAGLNSPGLSITEVTVTSVIFASSFPVSNTIIFASNSSNRSDDIAKQETSTQSAPDRSLPTQSYSASAQDDMLRWQKMLMTGPVTP